MGVSLVRWCTGTISPLFSEKTPMSTPQDDNQPVVWAVLVAVIVLAVGLAIGFGIAKSKKAAPAAPAIGPLQTDSGAGDGRGAVLHLHA